MMLKEVILKIYPSVIPAEADGAPRRAEIQNLDSQSSRRCAEGVLGMTKYL